MKHTHKISLMQSAISTSSVSAFILICFFISIDSCQFVYPCLSQTLLGGILIIILSVAALLHWMLCRGSLPSVRCTAFVLLWMAYLFFHSVLIAEAETYRLIYLEESLLLLPVLSYLLYNGILSLNVLEGGLILILCIQLVYLCLQYLGIIDSGNNYFPFTGCSDNPNCTAMYIALSLPLAFERIRTGRYPWLYLTISILSVAFLFLLNCRTAFIGLLTVGAIRIFLSCRITGWIWKRSVMTKVWLLLTALMVVTVSSVAIYHHKQGSADGRILIWKVSAMMIMERPQGSGIGMFGRDYNLSQGEYFASGQGTDRDRYIASTANMAYNDILEQGVESGIIGMVFMLMFYVFLMIGAYRSGMMLQLSVVTAVFIMSLMNFICASVQSWMLFLCIGACIISMDSCRTSGQKHDRQCRRTGKAVRCLAALPLLFCLAVLADRHVRLTGAQYRLKIYEDMKKNGTLSDTSGLESLSADIGASEAYWNFMYEVFYERKDFKRALACAEKASEYTYLPSLCFRKFNCHDRLGQTSEGVKYIENVRNVIPQNLTSRIVLMKWYDSIGEYVKALDAAHEIASMEVKIRNERSASIQEMAEKYIESRKIYQQH